MKVIPLSNAIAAEIRDVDLCKALTTRQVDGIVKAWTEHLVVVFRAQQLTNSDLERFGAYFGELEDAPLDKNGILFVPNHPKLLIISNVKENGRPIGGLANVEAVWHTHISYNEVPPKASALYAREVPATGGDTGFLNMYAAYEGLPDALKAKAEGLRIKHDSTHNSAGHLRYGMNLPADLPNSPGAVHPAVSTHPHSGRRALLLGRRPHAYIMGLSVDESETILDELWAHCDQPKYYWHHQWQVGDLVMWDNRCTMHRRDAFDDAERRVMYRTQIAGHRPYLAA